MEGKILLVGLLAFSALGVGSGYQHNDLQERLEDALLTIGQTGAANWNDFDKDLWPYFDTLRHFDMFEERTKRVHKQADDFHFDRGIFKNITCAICETVATIVLDAIGNETPIEDLEDIIANICMGLHIEEDPVCQGIVKVYGPYLKFVIDRLDGKATSELFCGVFVDEDCMTPEVSDLVSSWEVELPPTTKPEFQPPKLPDPEAPSLKVLHFTDLHIDLSYLPGSNPDCGMPCCCMNTTGLATGDERRAGFWGDIADCDLPIWTFAAMMAQIKERHGDELAYAIYTGDSPPHDVWQQSMESNSEHSKRVFEVYEAFLPDVPLYFSLGNHEGFVNHITILLKFIFNILTHFGQISGEQLSHG
eukprot:maker-scaffold229_size244821-snap-gene-1.14 protein:Tk01409 transcript:maker-scaffold229_size244821-snap-gene-1.14-mRNA-1 annotation:"hypothetical protein TcasGA2_TC005858"